MPEIDRTLHAERSIPGGGKRSYDDLLGQLPVGTFFEFKSASYLVSAEGYLPWSFDGYGDEILLDQAMSVKVLTPQSMVKAFLAGFVPVHT